MPKEKMIKYDAVGDENTTTVMVSKIVRMYKSEDNRTTYIKLTNDEILESNDSINTLQARINAED